MFVDEVRIEVHGGSGGRGCVSWRREKYVPKGGPDGGDGGRGGNVILQADANTDTLSAFSARKSFTAPPGQQGMGSNCAGRTGEDLILHVPPGTLVWAAEAAGDAPLADLVRDGDRFVAARGGRGGYGNAHFVSSVRQRPDFAELGEPGASRSLRLELRLVADVAIIGLPNVGKSTFIAAVSSAKPKIADYPFTTLVPNLGVAHIGERSVVLCDIPGLIEGAHEGKGLGHRFLRHIERCRIVLHLLDTANALTPAGDLDRTRLMRDYETIRAELAAYSPALAGKREMIALSKADLALPERIAELQAELHAAGIPVRASISAATGKGVQELLYSLLAPVLEARKQEVEAAEDAAEQRSAELPVLRPGREPNRMSAYAITKESDGSIVLTGERLEQLAIMTDFGSPGAVQRLLDVLERIGATKQIAQLRGESSVPVRIGDVRVDAIL